MCMLSHWFLTILGHGKAEAAAEEQDKQTDRGRTDRQRGKAASTHHAYYACSQIRLWPTRGLCRTDKLGDTSMALIQWLLKLRLCNSL